MKPDWDALGEKYEDSKKVIIGDVDCTVHQDLCGKYEVEGYPTLKVFHKGDKEGEAYEGERDLKSLKKFAKSLGPKCTVETWEEHCSAKQKAELQPYIDMAPPNLMSQMAELRGELKEVEQEHEALMKTLQEQFEASEKKLKAKKEELNPKLKLMRAALKQEDLDMAREAAVAREAAEAN